jgi:hypothetical protein
MRDSYPFTAIDPVPYSSRVRAQGLSAQFRMILICTRTQATSGKRQAASFFILDNKPYIWDKVITINKRIKYANSKRIRRKIYRAWQQAQSLRNEVHEPTCLRLWDGGTAAGAGRPLQRGREVHHGLASSSKLRDLHAAAAGTDGRGASRVRVRGTGERVPQEVQVQGQRQSIQITDRGLRAPDRESGIKNQAASGKQQASSYKQQAILDRVPRIEARDTSVKQQAASGKLR